MRPAPIVALLILLLGFGALPASADAVDTAVAAARGAGLATHPHAETTANASAARQATDQNVSHASIGHLASACDRAAEIVGSGPSVELVFAGFRGSPNHWSKLSDPGWTSMGTGAAEGADGKVYVSVVFCQAAGASAPPQAPPPQPAAAPVPSAPPVPQSAGQRPPERVTVEIEEMKVDLVGLLTAILTTSLDSLTAESGDADPIASLLDRFVTLPPGVQIL